METDDQYEGSSPNSFAAAAQDAVGQFEKRHGVQDEPVTFRVVDMYVVAQHNPVHDYRIILRPS